MSQARLGARKSARGHVVPDGRPAWRRQNHAAKKLAAEHPALRLSPDSWITPLFGEPEAEIRVTELPAPGGQADLVCHHPLRCCHWRVRPLAPFKGSLPDFPAGPPHSRLIPRRG